MLATDKKCNWHKLTSSRDHDKENHTEFISQINPICQWISHIPATPLRLKVSSNAIPRYQSQLSAMLQEHIACSLLGVDSDPVVGDDCAGNTQGHDNFNG